MAISDAGQVDPTRLTVEQLVKVLSAAYRERLEVANVRKHIEAGAPTNADGTLNMVHYVAWLTMEMGRGE